MVNGMDQHSLHEVEARCTQESPPRCRVACPFGLDVRAFLALVAEGRMLDARKLYERHVPLPGILGRICDAPCEQACLRRDLGGSIALHALESACVQSVPAQTKPLPLPPKKGRMAVLGAGLAGLVAAWDLSRKGYLVTIFHEGRLADVLCEHYAFLRDEAAGGRDPLVDDVDMLARQKVIFSEQALDAALLAEVDAAFDAVLIDAVAAKALLLAECASNNASKNSGKNFDESMVDALTRHWRTTLCVAGGLSQTPTGHTFASASDQAGQGRQAARSMERLAGNMSLTAARDKEQGQLHTALEGVTAQARVEPAAVLYTTEEAAAEAARCLQCSCMICVKECVYLQKYKGYPRTYARQIYNNASIVKGLHTANAMVNGCALCGQCEEVCPENFSMAELCLSARQDMVTREFMPPSAHEFALEDMQSASAGDCALLLVPGEATTKLTAGLATGLTTGQAIAVDTSQHTAARLFFPGCQLAAARGSETAALYAHLRESIDAVAGGTTAIYLSCCGIPAHWAGREALFAEHGQHIRMHWQHIGKPEILAACSSCLTALRVLLPEARCTSVWEKLDTLPLPASAGAACGAAVHDEALWVHDPCTARHDTAWLTAVRSLAAKCGLKTREPRLSGATTPCCGYGGLVWCAQPELAHEMSAQRAADLPGRALASCIMCRDRLAAAGTECLHLLDVLFPSGCTTTGVRTGPGLSARRAGRAALRKQLLRDYGGPGESAPVAAYIFAPEGEARWPGLTVAPELLARLEDRHILRTDVEAAVAAIEASKVWFENTITGHRLGAHRPRRVTFWVEYGVLDAGFVLYDAYCHRMIVPGAGQTAEADELEGGCRS